MSEVESKHAEQFTVNRLLNSSESSITSDVGWKLGREDGCAEGWGVGALEGALDGSKEMVGCCDGDALGDGEGRLDGS